MQKIETLFKRDEKFRAIDEVNEGCEWVADGEGVATVKFDGSACAIIDGKLYKRHAHDAKKGSPPTGWVHWSFNPTATSGHGWLLCVDSDPSCRYHFEAWVNFMRANGPWSPGAVDGTYELVGPKSNGNPERIDRHELWRHGEPFAQQPPRDFVGLRKFLEDHPCEGIVWHHPDGRMVKLKRRDFGIPWPAKASK